MGLVIAFGIWRANIFFKNSKSEITSETAEPSESASPTPQFGLTLAKPSDDDVITETPTTLSGVTQPGSWVVISAEGQDYLVQADNKGGFSESIDLTPGVNQILISSFGKDASESPVKLTVAYSSEFAKLIPGESPPPSGTGEGDIRQKVLKKVEEVLSSPKAVLGVVTDISATTIQVKSPSSDIRQVAVQKDVTVIKGTKEVKLADIAIGDFIVAMGFRNGNGVLDAKRILITAPIEEPTRKIIAGKVTEITKKDITIAPLTEGAQTTLIPSKSSNIKLSGFKIDDIVVAVTLPGKNGLEVRTLEEITFGTPQPAATPTGTPAS